MRANAQLQPRLGGAKRRQAIGWNRLLGHFSDKTLNHEHILVMNTLKSVTMYSPASSTTKYNAFEG
jgi:hypothetical protein